MRVLHLPINIASQISATVRGLRSIGIQAQGIVLNNAVVQSRDGVRNYVLPPRNRRAAWTAAEMRLAGAVLPAIARADVVHWHFATPGLPGALDLRWARWLGKPGVVEFWGSDIRIPEEEARDNPYYARLGPDYEYRGMEGRELSYARQERFAQQGIRACFAIGPFDRFLKPGLFAKVYRNRGRVILADFEPAYPRVDKPRPILVHSPTAKVGKGTAAVLAAVDQLAARFDFEFRLIHGVQHARAMEMMRGCDVMVDQLVDGTTYGIAAIEAMAFGKPVVCYLKPSAVPFLPAACPIVNANQENLVETLAALLASAQRRRDIGVAGRAYVETYHDANKYAQELVAVYQELIDCRTKGP